MVCVSRTCNDRVNRPPFFIQHPKLLPPHHRTMIHMVAQARPVVLSLAHLQRRQLLSHGLIRVAAPRGIV